MVMMEELVMRGGEGLRGGKGETHEKGSERLDEEETLGTGLAKGERRVLARCGLARPDLPIQSEGDQTEQDPKKTREYQGGDSYGYDG